MDEMWSKIAYVFIYTKILEVSLFAIAYRLFHGDFPPIDGTLYHLWFQNTYELYYVYIYHTIIRAAFVCGCVPHLLRGSLTDLRQTSWVYVGRPPICRWGVLFEKVNGSLSLSTILYRCQPHATQLQKAPFALMPQLQSLIRRLLLLHLSSIYVGGPRNCYSGVLFLKGRRVNGSTGHFHFHYIIYDSRRRQAHVTPLQKAHGLDGSMG